MERRLFEIRGSRAFHADRGLLAPLALEVHVYGPLARDGPPLGAGAQAPHFRADWGDRRSPNYQLAGGHRRRAQLGLPLHLDQGRCLHTLRPLAHRVHRGGRSVHGLARGPLLRAEAGRLTATHVRIDGRSDLTEETLEHLEGYHGSRPDRIGNGAYNQLQLDIYGELMDAVYLYNKYGDPIWYELWTHLRRLI